MNCGESGADHAKDVLASVVLLHGTKWMRFAERVLGSHHDAEDVLQEAVRRVLVHNRLFQSKEDMKMYLGRTVSNTAIEFYHAGRRAKRRQVALQNQLIRAYEAETPLILLEEKETYALKARLAAILNRALEKLPRKQYEALRMTILNGNSTSIRKAGAVNGIPYSTLRHRSRQGILRLRRCVQKELDPDLRHLV